MVDHCDLSAAVDHVNMYRRSCATIVVEACEMEGWMLEVGHERPDKMKR